MRRWMGLGLLLAACGESAAVRVDASSGAPLTDASIVARDAAPADAEAEPSNDRLDGLARSAGGVLVGRVEAVRTDARVVQAAAVGYDWSIYYDEVDLQLERGVGTTLPPRATILGVPARCEATLDGVPQPDARLSTCSPREPGWTLTAGERVLVFVGGRGLSHPSQLAYVARIDDQGRVDLSAYGLSTPTVDEAWARVERARAR